MKGRSGSAPPIRDVTDAEVARHFPLVHYTLQRMARKSQLSGKVDYEDLVAVGQWAVWEALRRWDPGKGTQSTYLSSYVWGYVMKHQRDMTRALGYDTRRKEQLATVVSLDAALSDPSDDSYTLLSILPAPDSTDEAAEFTGRLADLSEWVESMREPFRTVARRRLFDDATCTDIAVELGVSRARIGQVSQRVMKALTSGELPMSMREPRVLRGGEEPRGPRPTSWTHNAIVFAIRRWDREHGRPPRRADWSRCGDWWPSAGTVMTRFGGWKNAIAAAGFAPPRTGPAAVPLEQAA